MLWSPQQDDALQKVSDWFHNSEQQVFRLFGYAGTGKTTLAKQIADDIAGDVFFSTFTGKAAHVLQQKGCTGACTIHSLIYHPKEKTKETLRELERQLEDLKVQVAEGTAKIEMYNRKKEELDAEKNMCAKPMFTLNLDSLARHADLLIIDECSMIDDIIGNDLLSFGTKVLVLGDPAQLPPVKGQGFFIQAQPDFMLTEIHRQAAENPIIRMATDIRNGRALALGDYGSSRVITRSACNQDLVLGADQVLVGRNKTRQSYNQRIRQLLGKNNVLPMINDKLVCLQNDKEYGLLNGQLWTVVDCDVLGEDALSLLITPYNDDACHKIQVDAHTHHFQGRELPWYEKKERCEFDYGYALTCHKAQGSQWDKVLVFDESSAFRENAQKWLYTAVTRAAEEVTVVKM